VHVGGHADAVLCLGGKLQGQLRGGATGTPGEIGEKGLCGEKRGV
jgi:hypothetical protein